MLCYFSNFEKGNVMVRDQLEKFISTIQSSIFRIIIYSVVHLPTDFPLGFTKHIKILTGSTASFIIDDKLYQYETHGALSSFSEKRLKFFFNSLVKYEMLEILTVDAYGMSMEVLNATKKGIDFLHSDEILNSEGKFKSDLLDLSSNEWELFNILRDLRADIANEEEVSAWVITNNAQLIAMCNMLPTSKEEMLTIQGIGPTFIEKYSDKFLDAIEIFTQSDTDDQDPSQPPESPMPSPVPESPVKSDDSDVDFLFEEEEQDDEMESIAEMEDRLQQETKNLQDFKKNIDPRPIWKQKEGNQGTQRWRNKAQNKERISTPHPSACKVCGTPTGKIYSYQCLKCKSPL